MWFTALPSRATSSSVRSTASRRCRLRLSVIASSSLTMAPSGLRLRPATQYPTRREATMISGAITSMLESSSFASTRFVVLGAATRTAAISGPAALIGYAR